MLSKGEVTGNPGPPPPPPPLTKPLNRRSYLDYLIRISDIKDRQFPRDFTNVVVLGRSVIISNISRTSSSVSSGFPNTGKLMKARGRRSSAFTVFECLETPMKHEARVFFEITSPTK